MRRSTQNMLYHLLPVVFWLLAIGGSICAVLWLPALQESGWIDRILFFLPAVIAMICIGIISRIRRHSNSVEECFQVSLLLGVAFFWLPTVVLLIVPIWIYLIYHNLFSFRSFVATLIGFATVALWAGIVWYILPQPIVIPSFTYHLHYWIPTGAALLAWLASYIARNILRVR